MVVFGIFFLYLRPTFAVDLTPTGIANGLIEGITSIALSVAKVFLGLTIAGLRIFIQLAAYNDYIDSPPVVVGWYMVRDLANMFFVVALLAIAFGTMLGLEQYEWKKSLVKLVMAAILINFSRLLIGLIIDASHIFTITFLDAIQGVAAGNLIGMLHLDKVFNLATGGLPPNDDLRLDLLGAAVMSVIFSLVAMLTIGAYLIMMALRVVVLWVLIILSPLAFIFSAIPQTKGYADEFWGEVSKNIIVAPIMVFFLWLAFATLGTGQINNHIGIKTGGIGSEDVVRTLSLPSNSAGSVSLLELSTWENMSGFIIAIVFLLVGLDRVQKTGATGSSFAGSVAEFGKKALTVGSGFAAARWAAGKTLSAAGDAASFVGGNALKYGGLGLYKGVEAGLFKASGGEININPEVVGNYFKRQVAGYKAWLAQGPEKEIEEDFEKVAPENRGQVVSTNAQGHRTLSNGITIDAEGYKLDASGNRIQKNGKSGLYWKYKREREALFEKAGENDVADAEGFKLDAAGQRVQMRDDKTGDLKFIEKGYVFKKDSKTGQNLLQRRYAALISSRKTLEKTENQFKNREELVDKRTTGKPEFWFQAFEYDGRNIDAVDRVEQGELKGEQARSAAKTKEYHTAGEELVIKSPRFKDGGFEVGAGKKTVAGQIADHELQSERTQQFLDTVLSQARTANTKDKKDIVQAKVFGKLQLEASDAKRGQLEGKQTTYLAQQSLAAQKEIQDAIAGERGSHEESEKLELEKKRQETSYLQSPLGQHELEEEAKLKAELGLEEKKIERMATGAEAAFSRTVGGGQTAVKAKEEELRTNLFKNVLSAEEERSKGEARINLRSVAEKEQLEKMNAEFEAERTKGIEAEQKNKVAASPSVGGVKGGKEILTEIEEQRILSGKAEGMTKEQIEEAKLEATRRRDIEVRESKEAEIRANATAEEVKDLEESAKRKATSSQAAAVLRGKEAAVRAGAESAETKEIESRAARLAAATQVGSLDRTKAADIRTGAEEGEAKTAEEAAKRRATQSQAPSVLQTKEAEARTAAEAAIIERDEARAKRRALETQRPSLDQTQREKLRTALQQAKIKELEEAAKAGIVTSPGGAAIVRETKQAEVRAGESTARFKSVDADALREAQRIEQAALLGKQRADINAAASTEEVKEQEVEAKRQATEEEFMRPDEGALGRGKRAKVRADASGSETKEYDEEAQKAARIAELDSLERQQMAEERAKTAAAESATILAEAAKAAIESLGSNFIARSNLAEQAKKAAEDFVKVVKSADLQKQFEKATEAIRAAEKVSKAELDSLAARSPFVAALRMSKVLSSQEEVTNIAKSDAESDAEAVYVEKHILGYVTPTSSLVSVSKRYGDALNSFTNAALGKALTDNLAFVANHIKKKGGGKVEDLQIRAGMFGTVNKVNTEAYIDDTIGEMAKQINRLEAGEISDPEEAEKLEDLRKIWEGQLGVIERDKDGQAFARSNARNASIVQNYAISGGDVEYLQQHSMIEAGKQDDESYGQAADRIFKELIKAGTVPADAYDQFIQKLKDNDTFTKEAASSFKSQALAAGHEQLGGHQMFDSSLGVHRMATAAEAAGTMEGELRKRGNKAAIQYQSLGDVNTTTAILEKIDMRMVAATFGQIKKFLDFKPTQDRTVDGITGHQPSAAPVIDIKTKDGMLGGGERALVSHFGSVDRYLEDNLIPLLISAPEAFALACQRKFSNGVSTTDAEQGVVKVKIEGAKIDGDDIAAGSIPELIAKLEKYFSDKGPAGKAIIEKYKDELDGVKAKMTIDPNKKEDKKKKKKAVGDKDESRTDDEGDGDGDNY
ncbi:MAG: hypothetical protein KBD73_02030 [Candidatus Magasanikbacteria bacterium]|nr:hypothetical protein [Candidatus Magasanikbacteria bacterium]